MNWTRIVNQKTYVLFRTDREFRISDDVPTEMDTNRKREKVLQVQITGRDTWNSPSTIFSEKRRTRR